MAENAIATRDEELEVVKTAYYLENNVAELQKEYKRLRQPEAPTAPKLLEVKPQEPKYPEITPPNKFENETDFFNSKIFKKLGIISIILTIIPFTTVIGIPMLIYCYYSFYKERKTLRENESEKYINYIKNSDEYKNKCKQIEEQCQNDYLQKKQAAQKAFDEKTKEYEAAKKEYDDISIPQYYEEKEALTTALNDAQATLDEFYNTSKVIPAQYHNIPALAWIALYMNTSSFDLKNAIERWDTYVMQCQQREHIELAEAQVNVLREQLTNQSYSNWLQEQLIDLTENGNKTLKSISNWQKSDIAVREYRRIKARRNKR